MTKEEKIQLIKTIPLNNITRILRCQYIDLYNEINNLYPQLSEYPFKQKLYWYINNLIDFPKCKCCGKNISYIIVSLTRGYGRGFCSLKCSNNDLSVKEKKKQTCRDHFNTDNPFQSEEVKTKYKQTCKARYGVEHTSQIEGIQDRIRQSNFKKYGVDSTNKLDETQRKKRQTCLARYGVDCVLKTNESIQQRKQTCLKKYGVEYALQVPKLIEQRKQTCLKKYGVENPSQSGIIQEKKYQTQKKNNSFSYSKDEEYVFSLLTNKYGEVLRQHKTDKYPFKCDFYIPALDMYIELNFSWTHGKEPYNKTHEHRNVVDFWKIKSNELNFKGKKKRFYNAAIRIWTIRDPLKRKTAIDNNLNWFCFYNMKQFNEWFKKQ